MSKVVKRFRGRCPRTHDVRTITIYYDKLFVSCDPHPHYVKAEWLCDNWKGCPYLDPQGFCELYNSAPESLSR